MSDTSESGWDCWVVGSGCRPGDVPPHYSEDARYAGTAAEKAVQSMTRGRGWSIVPLAYCEVWVQRRGTREEPMVYQVLVKAEIEYDVWRKP